MSPSWTTYSLPSLRSRPASRIAFSVPSGRGPASLRVFDVQGRLVRTLLRDATVDGGAVVGWDGRDERGVTVSSGVYFYRLETIDGAVTRKMTVLR